MSLQDNYFYQFGDFLLDVSQRVLLSENKPVALAPKAFDTLLFLVKNHGRLVEKSELMEAVWAGSFVEEGNLPYNIRIIRKALSDDSHAPRFIETVSRRGYRFIAPVEKIEPRRPETIEKPENTLTGEKNPIEQGEPRPQKDFSFYTFRRFGILTAVLFVILLLALGGAFLSQRQKKSQAKSLWASDESEQPSLFSKARFQKLTDAGTAAISPDGRLIVYTNVSGGGKQSLWIRQIATERNFQIIQPQNSAYFALQFSRDGEYVYFTRSDGKNSVAIYRIPALGGLATEIVKESETGFSLSPDNEQIAFIRSDRTQNKCSLWIARIGDGAAGQRRIVERERPRCYGTVAWSPDGDTIVATVGQSDTGDANTELIETKVADGSEKPFSSRKWHFISRLGWLPDKSGLILSAREKPNDYTHLWQISAADGTTRQLTNDLTNYSNISLTSDGNRLLVTQTTLESNMSVAAADAPESEIRLSSAFGNLSWMPNGKLVYSTHTNGNNLWLINADGSEQEQLTFNENINIHPVASPDGRFIVFVSARTGAYHIWRMNSDGSNKVQLTDGTGEQAPEISPDGRWVFYQKVGTNQTTVWKVPLEGGTPVQVLSEFASRPAVSPDGKLLAYFYREGERKERLGIAVMSLEGEESATKRFSVAGGNLSAGRIRWSADGKSVAYATENTDFVANIWQQDLDGAAAARKLTNFTTERIFDFGWSPDGKLLAMVRGSWHHEAVLVSAGQF